MSTRREEPRALTMEAPPARGCPGARPAPTRGLLSSPGATCPPRSTRAQLGFARLATPEGLQVS